MIFLSYMVIISIKKLIMNVSNIRPDVHIQNRGNVKEYVMFRRTKEDKSCRNCDNRVEKEHTNYCPLNNWYIPNIEEVCCAYWELRKAETLQLSNFKEAK